MVDKEQTYHFRQNWRFKKITVPPALPKPGLNHRISISFSACLIGHSVASATNDHCWGRSLYHFTLKRISFVNFVSKLLKPEEKYYNWPESLGRKRKEFMAFVVQLGLNGVNETSHFIYTFTWLNSTVIVMPLLNQPYH